ncbi:Multicilin [Lonchura striata]|uniref:Multicilin n=1 Tax=Lonchura striata TaxID=40157 RepID=A0A218V9H1_9PASE|nr:Multicilin [Lonchura striata domestica]
MAVVPAPLLAGRRRAARGAEGARRHRSWSRGRGRGVSMEQGGRRRAFGSICPNTVQGPPARLAKKPARPGGGTVWTPPAALSPRAPPPRPRRSGASPAAAAPALDVSTLMPPPLDCTDYDFSLGEEVTFGPCTPQLQSSTLVQIPPQNLSSPELCWRDLADQHQKALGDALEANSQLQETLTQKQEELVTLRESNVQLKELASQARQLAAVLDRRIGCRARQHGVGQGLGWGEMWNGIVKCGVLGIVWCRTGWCGAEGNVDWYVVSGKAVRGGAGQWGSVSMVRLGAGQRGVGGGHAVWDGAVENSVVRNRTGLCGADLGTRAPSRRQTLMLPQSAEETVPLPHFHPLPPPPAAAAAAAAPAGTSLEDAEGVDAMLRAVSEKCRAALRSLGGSAGDRSGGSPGGSPTAKRPRPDPRLHGAFRGLRTGRASPRPAGRELEGGGSLRAALGEAGAIRTLAFPQGNAFTLRTAAGGHRFRWVPR